MNQVDPESGAFAGDHRCLGGGVNMNLLNRAAARLAHSRVKRFDGPATEPFESLNDQNFVKILSEFGKICQNPSKIVKFEES